MINETILEGVVTSQPWAYDKDIFFRVASYRDANTPVKPNVKSGREEPDYINVRVIGGATSMFAPRPGLIVRVHGFLQSRDFQESLKDFLAKARKNGVKVPAIEDSHRVTIDRNLVELVATRVIVMRDSQRREDYWQNGMQEEPQMPQVSPDPVSRRKSERSSKPQQADPPTESTSADALEPTPVE